MSAIVNFGQNPQPTPPPHTQITFKSARNKFEVIAEDILFGPGMVTRFAHSIFKILDIVDEHFYLKQMQERMKEPITIYGSVASLLLYPESISKSNEAQFYSKSENAPLVDNQQQTFTDEDIQEEVSQNGDTTSESKPETTLVASSFSISCIPTSPIYLFTPR
jgi:hypothetical protein